MSFFFDCHPLLCVIQDARFVMAVDKYVWVSDGKYWCVDLGVYGNMPVISMILRYFSKTKWSDEIWKTCLLFAVSEEML